MPLDMEKEIDRLRKSALNFGALDAKLISADSIVVGDWVRLKCQYGCNGYGKKLTCPPYSPKPEETKRILQDYDSALLFRVGPSRIGHEVVVKLEREAFLGGFYRAFGLGEGPCPFCKACNLQRCVHPELARPSMEACGIDVYATVRKAGFELNVVTKREQKPNFFGLLLVN
jgi:predicted metal-binding protein